jgi:hypothetical protein
VKLPSGPGLDELAIRSDPNRTEVPIVAHGAHSPAAGKILVVLPALTWQGQNPVDGDADGIPDTLDAGVPVGLGRTFARGLPSGFADEAALIAYLEHARLPYELTTDFGIIDGKGPGLFGRTGVVLAGSERWVPSTLSGPLRAFVNQGHRVLVVGPDSLRRSVTIRSTPQGPEAVDPTAPAVADALGAKTGPFVPKSPGVVLTLSDSLGLFSGTSNAFPSFTAYQPITGTVPPASQIQSGAGPSTGSDAIAGYRLGSGIVVNIGVSGFGSMIAGSVDAQELIRRLWTILGH